MLRFKALRSFLLRVAIILVLWGFVDTFVFGVIGLPILGESIEGQQVAGWKESKGVRAEQIGEIDKVGDNRGNEVLDGNLRGQEGLGSRGAELSYQKLPEPQLPIPVPILEVLPHGELVSLPSIPIEVTYDLDGGVAYTPTRSARKDYSSYMGYTTITNRSSRQWELQHGYAQTDGRGLRIVNEMPTVAVGTAYLNKGVGDILEVVLDTGMNFFVVVGDVKSDAHTDPTRTFTVSNGCMLEFIVDIPMLMSKAKAMGNARYCGYEGNITQIRNTGSNVFDQVNA